MLSSGFIPFNKISSKFRYVHSVQTGPTKSDAPVSIGNKKENSVQVTQIYSDMNIPGCQHGQL